MAFTEPHNKGLNLTQYDKEECFMDKQIIWYDSMDAAMKEAKVEKKTILADFFNPG
jgi:hypothetical protein